MAKFKKKSELFKDQEPSLGHVKWFDKDKGFGFVINNTTQEELFFHVTRAEEETFATHEEVSFISIKGRKGPEAINVKKIDPQFKIDNIVPTGSFMDQDPPITLHNITYLKSKEYDSGKETCQSCHKQMYPRVVFGKPLTGNFSGNRVAKYSVCPYCGSRHKSFWTPESIGYGVNIIPIVIVGMILLSMIL